MAEFKQLYELLAAQPDAESSAKKLLQELGTPSASIAILKDGVIHSSCLSSVGDDEDTVFQAASISKPVAGMAVMKLVYQGKLALDTPITEYLEGDVMDVIATERTKHMLPCITIRRLLSHTAGFTVHGFTGYPDYDNVPSTKGILAGRAPATTPRIKLAGLPGYGFRYSGGGTQVLQVVVESVMKRPFVELIRELVFQPLGMTHSFYGHPGAGVHHARAHYTGYQPCTRAYHLQPEHVAAGLWTTPTDLLKIIRAVQRSLNATDGSGFLSRDLVREMLTEVDDGMGLSWMVPPEFAAAFGHTGDNDPGFACAAYGHAGVTCPAGKEKREPGNVSNEFGLAVMTNSDNGIQAIGKLVHAISYVNGWPTSPNGVGFSKFKSPLVLPGEKVTGWEPWKGRWTQGWRIEANAEDESQPVAVHGNLPAVRLLRGAIPSIQYAEGKSLDLVLDGFEMMLSLGWEDAERVITLCNGYSQHKETLRLEDEG